MRFLLELVSCCGSAGAGGDGNDIPESKECRSEEIRALMVIAKPRCKRRKRGRVGAQSAPVEWKPSLSSISEDKAVSVQGRSERMVKRKGNVAGGGSRDTSGIRRYSEDNRGDHFTIIPTFSATPFMV